MSHSRLLGRYLLILYLQLRVIFKISLQHGIILSSTVEKKLTVKTKTANAMQIMTQLLFNSSRYWVSLNIEGLQVLNIVRFYITSPMRLITIINENIISTPFTYLIRMKFYQISIKSNSRYLLHHVIYYYLKHVILTDILLYLLK